MFRKVKMRKERKSVAGVMQVKNENGNSRRAGHEGEMEEVFSGTI